MKQKKLLALLIGLLCIAVCVVLLLHSCVGTGDEQNDPTTGLPTEQETTVNAETPEDTTPEETEPGETTPEETEPGETEPEKTLPEATAPEETEPEATEPANRPGLGNGFGGSYTPSNPGAVVPEEPETPTEPPVEAPTEGELILPEAGSEQNAYYEHITDTTGTFETVKIPAGGTVFYRVQTPGYYLSVSDGDVEITYDGKAYPAQQGMAKINLPADDKKVLSIRFTNKAEEEKAFAAVIEDALGSKTNPIIMTDLRNAAVQLEAGRTDGMYFRWTANETGELRLAVSGSVSHTVLVNGKADVGQVKTGDEVTVQLKANADASGSIPAASAVINAYVAETLELAVTEIPGTMETVSIAAGESVYYSISGGNGKILTVSDAGIALNFQNAPVQPDGDGKLVISLPRGTEPAVVEVINSGSNDCKVKLNFSHPAGHEMNPLVLTELGEIPLQTFAGEKGFCMNYTVPSVGIVNFYIWTYPELDDVRSDIILTNNTTGISTAIWGLDEAGDPVDHSIASMKVNPGDSLTIVACVKNDGDETLDASMAIYGELLGTQENPIPIQSSGFQAEVPAGATLYYGGNNLNGLLMSLTGNAVELTHNGVTYSPQEGVIDLTVVSEDRMPAVFGITNQSAEDQVFTASFAYPVGWAENPAQLLLGTNTLTQTAGADDYFYTFTAPKDGTLTLTFDPNGQWVYTGDNITQSVYGDTQYSDSDPQVPETVLTVKKDDVISVRVNTYDTANADVNPGGELVFTVKYVSGPTNLAELTSYDSSWLAGEYEEFTGQFYDRVLTLTEAEGITVTYDGQDYTASAEGLIEVKFPASSDVTEYPDLTFTVHNGTGAAVAKTITIISDMVGTWDNPQVLTLGEEAVFVQTRQDGDDYYFIVNNGSKRGTLKIDFSETAEDVDWVCEVQNLTSLGGKTAYSHTQTSKTVTLSVSKTNQDILIRVNTHDPLNDGNPVGEIKFTVY